MSVDTGKHFALIHAILTRSLIANRSGCEYLCVVKWKTIDSSMIYIYIHSYTYICTLEVEAFSFFPIRAKFLPFLPFNKYKHT